MVKTYDYTTTTSDITLPEPTREDYIFANWNSKADGTGTVYDNTSINELDTDTTVFAKWNYDGLVITFEENGGKAVSDMTVKPGEPIGSLPTTSKDNERRTVNNKNVLIGFVFDGWYREPTFKNKVSSASTFTEDTTLYARFIEDEFPYVYPYHEEEYVCTGSNYIDTGIRLYTDANNDYDKDFEVGFTIESYDPSEQVDQAVFFNSRLESSALGNPGLVFRRDSNKDSLEIAHAINNVNKSKIINDYTQPQEVRIYRIDHAIYYSLDGGETKIAVQNMSGTSQYFDTNAFFCAGDDGYGGAQKFLKGTISNYYIKMGDYQGTAQEPTTHTVTYPDESTETYYHNDIIELDANETNKPEGNGAAVTFVYNDKQTPNETRYVRNTYVTHGFKVNGTTHYDDYSTLVVDEDKVITYDYLIDSATPVEFPEEPTREGFTFDGWFDENDNKVTSYDGESDITLNAHWSVQQFTVTTPNGVTIVNYGEDYEVDDYINKDDDVFTITFKPHNGENDIVKHMHVTYDQWGWYDQYDSYWDSGETITVYEDIVLTPNYDTYQDNDSWPDDPYRDHYYFDGWYTEEDGGEYVDEYPDEPQDMILHAQWTGEEVEVCVEDSCDYDYIYGDQFTMWTYNDLDDDYIGDVEFVIPYEDDDDTDYREIYKRYTQIAWEDQNGTRYTENQVITLTENLYLLPVYDETILDVEFPEDPTREGNTFLGWFTDRDGGDEVTSYNDEYPITLYAHWDPEVLTVTTPNGVTTVNYGESYTMEGEIDKQADLVATYTFNSHNGDSEFERHLYRNYSQEGWEDQNGTTYSNDETIQVYENLVLNPYYSDYIDYDDSWPEAPEREHYTFNGWFTEEEDGIEVDYYDEDDLQDLTLHAQWVGEDLTVTTPNDTYYLKYGDEFTVEDDIEKDSETLANVTFYFNDEDDNTDNSEVIKEFTQTGWEDQNGHSYTSGQVITVYESLELTPVYEEEIIGAIFPDDPTREHYEFVGWFDNEYDGTEITSYEGEEDINIYAYWLGEELTVTTPRGTTYLHYGDEYQIEDYIDKDPDIIGTITFHNGDDIDERHIYREYEQINWVGSAGDTHDAGEWIYITYNEVYTPVYYEETTTDDWPDDPEKDNYTFVGWFTEDDEQVSEFPDEGDLDLYAHWNMTLPTDFDIDVDDITIMVGETHQIEVAFIPEGTEDTVTYTGYDDTKISVVDGIVTALAKGETTITVGLENVPDVTKTITVTIISDKLESEVYDVREADEDAGKDRVIIGAEPLTTIGEFKDNLLNPTEYVKIYDSEGNELDDDAEIRTGLIIKLEYNGITVDEAILVLRGDVDGDGVVNLADYMAVINHYVESNEITEYPFFLAADVDEDETVNMADAIKLLNYYTENIDTLND